MEIVGGRRRSVEIGGDRRRSVEVGGGRWRSAEIGGGRLARSAGAAWHAACRLVRALGCGAWRVACGVALLTASSLALPLTNPSLLPPAVALNIARACRGGSSARSACPLAWVPRFINCDITPPFTSALPWLITPRLLSVRDSEAGITSPGGRLAHTERWLGAFAAAFCSWASWALLAASTCRIQFLASPANRRPMVRPWSLGTVTSMQQRP